ncbi:MAG: protein phosphatase 2C domain-containing protein [Lactobacillales bacterium]|jgi:serine/threonine protein phosphatase PrpC|nr:protein phosphatase 2C domain-containing protein [Lactobacillales bacterium]
MKNVIGYATTAGIVKKINQDSLCLKSARTPVGEVVMAVICDGMGGLDKGELASATVVKAFDEWFSLVLPYIMPTLTWQRVQEDFDKIIRETNRKIYDYGKSAELHLGTTLTAILIVGDEYAVTVHVGDTRLYRVNDTEIELLTEDQTVVQHEVKEGIITPDQALKDPRKNILLQCIGFDNKVFPVYDCLALHGEESYLLCSDGFRHEITELEMLAYLKPGKLNSEKDIEIALGDLATLNETREETDNISAIVVKRGN